MENFCWSIFEKSGDINAFIAYKEFNKNKKQLESLENKIIDNY